MKLRAFLPVAFITSVASAAPLGLTAETAGMSARQIALSGPTSTGFYWFDFDGAGGQAAFQTYADMTSAGGGWMLGLHSIQGSEAPSTDITANVGSASLASGFTRNFTYWAIDQSAQIRHRITAASGTVLFDGFYTGNYHGTMANAGGWTVLQGSLAAVGLDFHAGKDWSTVDEDRDDNASGNCATAYGNNGWYYGNCWGVLPTGFVGPSGPQLGNGTALGSYDIFVRELVTPALPPTGTEVPEPATLGMALVALGAAFAARCRAQRPLL